MFEITNGLAPAIEKGAFMQFSAPSGVPLVDDDKEPVGVMLRARNSVAALKATRDAGNARLRIARSTPNFEVTVEGNEAEFNEVLAACTVSWTFDTLDGNPFPCTRENALKFWSDDRFRRWRGEAADFISSEANFTKA